MFRRGKHACQGLKIHRGELKESCFQQSHTHLPLQKLRPARHRAELFVCNHMPKASIKSSPYHCRSTDKTPPDWKESLVPLAEVGGRRYNLGRQEFTLPVPPEEEELHDPVSTQHAWATVLRLSWGLISCSNKFTHPLWKGKANSSAWKYNKTKLTSQGQSGSPSGPIKTQLYDHRLSAPNCTRLRYS